MPANSSKSGAAEAPAKEAESLNRKNFLTSAFLMAGSFAAVGAIGYRIFQYLIPQKKTEREIEVPVCAESEIREGEFRIMSIDDLNVIVIRNQGQLKAFSRICTHLNCIVQWQKESQKFHCPCHHGYFDVNGKVVGGPPPKPLPTYDLIVRDKTVFLKYKTSGVFL